MNIKEFHALIDQILSPRFTESPDLRKAKCYKLLTFLDEATAIVKEELTAYIREDVEDRRIRHTLENTPLIPPDEEDIDNAQKTIHGEK